MKKIFNLINPKDIDVDSFNFNIELYLNIVKNQEGKILGSNEKGLIFLIKYKYGYMVLFIFVKEDFRETDNVERSLLDSANEYCRRLKKWFYLKVIYSGDSYLGLEKYANENSFHKSEPQILYITSVDEESYSNLLLFQKKTQFLVSDLESQGYITNCFKDSPIDVLNKVIEYSNVVEPEKRQLPYDMGLYDNSYNQSDICFITYKDQEPVAVTINKRYGNSIVCHELFCLMPYWYTGAFILPLLKFLNYIIDNKKDIDRVSFMLLSSNFQIRVFFEKYLTKIIRKSTEQMIFFRSFKEDKSVVDSNS